MSERLTVALEDGTKELLVQLAGGERKVGAYLSALIRDVHEHRLVDAEKLDALAQDVDQELLPRLRRLEEHARLMLEREQLSVRSLAEQMEWINEQLPDALRRYAAMSDEQKASVKDVYTLLPAPPGLQARFMQEMQKLTDAQQALYGEGETPSDVQ